MGGFYLSMWVFEQNLRLIDFLNILELVALSNLDFVGEKSVILSSGLISWSIYKKHMYLNMKLKKKKNFVGSLLAAEKMFKASYILRKIGSSRLCLQLVPVCVCVFF